MQRPYFASLLVFVLAAAVLFSGIGCGGGGGGSSSGGSSGNTGGRPSGVIFSQSIVGTAPGSSTARSVANLEVGDRLNLRSLALYVLELGGSAGGYSGGFFEDLTTVTLDAPGVATLDGTTITAVAPGTGTITAFGANGVSLTATVRVSTNLASVTGRVRGTQVGTANAGVSNVSVVFYNSTGDELARVLTGPDGRYQANVPPNATRFVADFSVFVTSFYNQFAYENIDYSGDISGCGAPLPSISTTATTTLSDSIAYRKGTSNPPPPPPTGCTS